MHGLERPERKKMPVKNPDPEQGLPGPEPGAALWVFGKSQIAGLMLKGAVAVRELKKICSGETGMNRRSHPNHENR